MLSHVIRFIAAMLSETRLDRYSVFISDNPGLSFFNLWMKFFNKTNLSHFVDSKLTSGNPEKASVGKNYLIFKIPPTTFIINLTRVFGICQG